MSIARILQWPIRLPLQKNKRLSKKDQAKKTAEEIEELGEIKITYFSQHIGYVNLGVESKDGKTKLWVRITHSVHFRGRFTKVPKLESATHIKFKARKRPLMYGDREEFSSYLEIEKVR